MTDRIGYGAASLGNLYRPIDDASARAALHEAWECGIRYFDTAPHYGLGLSERRLGDFLQSRQRDRFRLSTKVGRLLQPNPAYRGGTDEANEFVVPDDRVRVFDPSADGIARSLDDSRERMGIDRFDIVYLHDPDVYDLDRGISEGLPALARLREFGEIDEIGIGVNSAAAAARAVREADIDVVMIAGRYTLLEQPAATELLPACAERGVRVVAAAVFNSGLLASADPATAHYDYGSVPPAIADRARLLAECCARYDVPLAAAALQYPLRHPQISTVVFGTGRASAIRENTAWAARDIPDDLWRELAERELIPDDQIR